MKASGQAGGVSGGVEAVVRSILDALAERSEDFLADVVAFAGRGEPRVDGLSEVYSPRTNVHYYNFDAPSGFWRLFPNFVWQNATIRRHIAAMQPDTVHVHLPQWLPFGLRRAKLIRSVHGYRQDGQTLFSHPRLFIPAVVFQALGCWCADEVVSVSRELLDDAILRRLAGHIHFVPNTISTSWTALAERELPVGPAKLVMLGQVTESKRQNVGVEVLNELKEEYPSLRLEIFGNYLKESKYVKSIENKIGLFGLQDRVYFHGSKKPEEIFDLLNSSTIGLNLSVSETFGLSTLELILSGVKVISTPVGVMKWDRNEFEGNGVKYITFDSIEDISRSIRFILSGNDNFVDNKGAADFVLSKYAFPGYLGKYVEIYGI